MNAPQTFGAMGEESGFLASMQKAMAPVLDFLFPPHCPACDAYVETRGAWCAACLANALRIRRLPLSGAHRKVIDEAWAFGVYQGALRSLLLPLKFKGRTDGLPALGTFLLAADEKLPRAAWMPGIAVPVPLFPKKEKTRGYNQTELIFRAWLEADGWTWRRALRRTRMTEPQYGLDAVGRAANVRDAFTVSDDEAREAIAGRPVLLLDDIFTTGSTLAECARVLKKAGAESVVAWVLASDRD